MRAINQNTFTRTTNDGGLKAGKVGGGDKGMANCGETEDIC